MRAAPERVYRKTHRSLRTQLDRLKQQRHHSPWFRARSRRDAYWVKPMLVAQIAFSTWTRDNLVRQAAFKGLREDKSANEVVRETPTPPEPPSHSRGSKSAKAAAVHGRKKETGTVIEPITHLAITHPRRFSTRKAA